MGSKLGSFLRVLGAGLSPQAFAAQTNEFSAEQASKRSREAQIETIGLKQGMATASILGKAYDAETDPTRKKEIMEEVKVLAERATNGNKKAIGAFKSAWLSGRFEDVKAKKEVNLHTLVPPGGGTPKSFRKDDPRVDKLMNEGWTPAPSQRQEGKIPATAKQKMDALGSNVSEMEFIGNEIISKMKENPNILNVAGGLSRLTDSLKEQTLGLAQEVFNIEVTASQDINQYDWSKAPAAAKSAEMQTNLLNLAVASAASFGDSGKSLSDKDVQRYIDMIGGSTGSRTQLEARIKAVIRSGKRRYVTQYKQTHGKSPSMSIFKRSDIEQSSPEKEAEIDSQLQETRKLLDALKKKYKVD